MWFLLLFFLHPVIQAFEIPLGSDNGLGILTAEVEVPGTQRLGISIEGPRDFFLDDGGKIYFLDQFNEEIRVFEPQGALVSRIKIPNPSKEEYSLTHLGLFEAIPIVYEENKNQLLFLKQDAFKRYPLEKKDLIVRQLSFEAEDRVLLLDGYSASVFGFHPGKKKLQEILPQKDCSLSLVRQAQSLVCQKADPQNPEIVHFSLASSKSTSSMFKTSEIPGLVEAEILEAGEHLAVALVTGGDTHTFIDAVNTYDWQGNLLKRTPLNLPVLPWKMQKQIVSRKGKICALSLSKDSNHLVVNMYP